MSFRTLMISLHLFVIACCLITSARRIRKVPKCLAAGNKAICGRINASISEPIHHNQPITELQLRSVTELKLLFVSGSIGKRTLSGFTEVEKLYLSFCNITNLEKGALCSLPKLKVIEFDLNLLPRLSKDHFSECEHVEELALTIPFEENALEKMTGLKSLLIHGIFRKAYIAPLKQLLDLSVHLKDFKPEPGMFCVESLENLRIETEIALEIPETLFKGCNSLRNLYFIVDEAIVPEGQNPFSNLTNLETLVLTDTLITHLTRDSLSGLPNLKTFRHDGSDEKEPLIDHDAFTDTKSLTELVLDGAELRISDSEPLYLPQNLVHLKLRSSKLQTINVLGSAPRLKIMTLDSNHIKKFDLAVLKKKFPKLEMVYLRNNPIDDDFADELDKEEFIRFRL